MSIKKTRRILKRTISNKQQRQQILQHLKRDSSLTNLLESKAKLISSYHQALSDLVHGRKSIVSLSPIKQNSVFTQTSFDYGIKALELLVFYNNLLNLYDVLYDKEHDDKEKIITIHLERLKMLRELKHHFKEIKTVTLKKASFMVSYPQRFQTISQKKAVYLGEVDNLIRAYDLPIKSPTTPKQRRSFSFFKRNGYERFKSMPPLAKEDRPDKSDKAAFTI